MPADDDAYEDVVLARVFEDGNEAIVIPLTFGRGRICMRVKAALFYDDNW